MGRRQVLGFTPTRSCYQALSFESCPDQPLFNSCISNKLNSKFKDPKMVSGQYPSPPVEDDGLSDVSAAPPMYTPSADGEASGEPSGEPSAGEPSAESYMPRLT